MKKSLLALAALSAFASAAQAQSSVTVYGVLDMGYSDLSTKAANSGGTGATTDTKGINSGSGLSSQRLGFRGTEDLGGGLSAGFTFEQGLATDVSTSGFSSTRLALISLSSKSLGSLNFGRGNTIGKDHNDTFSAFGGGASFEQGAVAYEVTRGKALANTEAVAITNAVDRASNQVRYTSPAFNGFTVQAQLQSKSVDTDATVSKAETSGTAIQLGYAAGPLTAAYTRTSLDTKTEASTTADTKTTVDQFGVTYTMGAVKVFGLYNDAEYQATAGAAKAENKGYDIGATYTMGKTTLLASFGDGEMKAAGATTVTDVSGMQAQVRYALSKRTTAYGLYGKTEYKGAAKGESDVTMIGVRHTF